MPPNEKQAIIRDTSAKLRQVLAELRSNPNSASLAEAKGFIAELSFLGAPVNLNAAEEALAQGQLNMRNLGLPMELDQGPPSTGDLIKAWEKLQLDPTIASSLVGSQQLNALMTQIPPGSITQQIQGMQSKLAQSPTHIDNMFALAGDSAKLAQLITLHKHTHNRIKADLNPEQPEAKHQLDSQLANLDLMLKHTFHIHLAAQHCHQHKQLHGHDKEIDFANLFNDRRAPSSDQHDEILRFAAEFAFKAPPPKERNLVLAAAVIHLMTKECGKSQEQELVNSSLLDGISGGEHVSNDRLSYLIPSTAGTGQRLIEKEQAAAAARGAGGVGG